MITNLSPISKSRYEVDIIMATYNGERYIEAQIDSILNQTFSNWQLLIRDDGSTDNTVEIVRRYAKQHPQITLIEDGNGNLGFNQNFFKLISTSESEYISICDQDDVWLPNKLTLCFDALKSTETPKKIPALVHSDAFIVDSNLYCTAEKWIGNRGNIEGLNGIAFANSVQGASVMFNKALKEIALTTPLKAPYDYHLALLSVFKGKRYYINQSLLKYRQHSNNAIGGMSTGSKIDSQHYLKQLKSVLGSLLSKLDYDQLSPTLHYSFGSYDIIKNNYSLEPIVDSQRKSLDEYFYIFQGKSTIKKLFLFIKNQYGFSSKRDSLTFFLLILLGRDLNNPTSWK